MSTGRRAFVGRAMTLGLFCWSGCSDDEGDANPPVNPGASGPDGGVDPERLAEVLALYFPGDALVSAATVGRAVESSLSETDTTHATGIIAAAASTEAAVEALRQAVEHDFAELRTSDALGWVLSSTELELGLLAASLENV